MAQQNVAQLDTNALFTQYLNVVNRSIGENKNSFPWNQLLKAGESILGNKAIGVAVYDKDADNPHDYFTIKFGGETFDIVSHGKSDNVDTIWKTQEKHLENVVTSPDEFVDNPARLDLDWLKTRLKN